MVNQQSSPNRFSSMLGRTKEIFLGPQHEYEDDEMAPTPSMKESPTPAPTRASQQIRMQSAMGNKVTIRRNVKGLEDCDIIADGLKNGDYQIVNTEKALPKDAERIIDFLNGVIYALNGKVKNIGDKVYLYVPSSVTLETDEGAPKRRPLSL